jgi:hypothetical protein
VSCSVFGGEVILDFVRSPDARWVPGPAIKNAKADEFEYRTPAPTSADGESQQLFELRTEDEGARRSEWAVSVAPK